MVALAFWNTRSTAMRELRRRIDLFARELLSVLILGETGTGKLLVAKTLHDLSLRSGNFINCNTSGFSADLIESLLFGHVKGAFTGAFTTTTGIFAASQGGTVLFDEVGDMPPSVQPRVLKAIDERVGYKVGSTEEEKYDFRLIAATCRPVSNIREDLLHRMSTLVLKIPALRERMDDLPELIAFLLQRHAGKDVRISADAMRRLREYDYPGNVRELDNILARAWVLSEHTEIELDHIEFGVTAPTSPTRRPSHRGPSRALTPLQEASVRADFDAGREASELAEAYDVSKATIYRAIRRKASKVV